jgi:hypothetical protein
MSIDEDKSLSEKLAVANAEIDRLSQTLLQIARGREDCGRPLSGSKAQELARSVHPAYARP